MAAVLRRGMVTEEMVFWLKWKSDFIINHEDNVTHIDQMQNQQQHHFNTDCYIIHNN